MPEQREFQPKLQTKKEPITAEILKSLVAKYGGEDANLGDIRYRTGAITGSANALSRSFPTDPTTSSPEKEGGM